MNDHDARRLRDQLVGAVPVAPAAPGRAAAAERRGRRRRLAAVAGTSIACVAAVAAVAVPLLAGGPGDPAPVAGPSGAATLTPEGTACRSADELTSGLDGADDAAWLRLCPGPHDWVFSASNPDLPSEVLTDGVDFLVDTWVRGDYPEPSCPNPVLSEVFSAQVGFADGTVRELVLRPASCEVAEFAGEPLVVPAQRVFDTVLERMGAQLNASVEPVDPSPPPDCPDNPRELEPGPGADAPSYGYLIPLPPRTTILCRYEVAAERPDDALARDGRTELSAAEGEGLRVAYHSRSGGEVECEPDPFRPAYSVLMEDVTGTWRIFTVDLTRCGTVTSDFDDYGLASPWLADALNRAWQAHQTG